MPRKTKYTPKKIEQIFRSRTPNWQWRFETELTATWEFSVTDFVTGRSTTILIPRDVQEPELSATIKKLYEYFDFFKYWDKNAKA